jgi:DNA-binding transcriptional ArsR family regulator
VNNQRFGGHSGSPLQIDDRVRLEIARRLRTSRQHRAQVFGPDISRDLPWDILLVLYTNDQARLTVTSVQAEVGAPQTTVLRWLRTLEDKGYMTRHRHPTDRRIFYLELSTEGRQTLDHYFAAIHSVERAAG